MKNIAICCNKMGFYRDEGGRIGLKGVVMENCPFCSEKIEYLTEENSEFDTKYTFSFGIDVLRTHSAEDCPCPHCPGHHAQSDYCAGLLHTDVKDAFTALRAAFRGEDVSICIVRYRDIEPTPLQMENMKNYTPHSLGEAVGFDGEHFQEIFDQFKEDQNGVV